MLVPEAEDARAAQDRIYEWETENKIYHYERTT